MGSTAALLTALLLAAPPGVALPVAPPQSTGLEDLVGARGGQAEGAIRQRGYVDVRAEKGDDRSYVYWWNADRRQCVTIATKDGRYASVQPTTPPDCGQSANLRPRPTPGYRPITPPRPDYQPDPGYGRPPYPPAGGPVVGGRPVDLGLVCFGDGTRDGIASGTTWTWNRDRDRYEYGRYNESRTEVFDASLMIQTWAGGGRIRLPRSLIPPINSRGDNGWWDLYDVAVGPDTIRATYRLNGLNKPKVVIDRRSGRITVQGIASYGFRGQCDLIGDAPRRF